MTSSVYHKAPAAMESGAFPFEALGDVAPGEITIRGGYLSFYQTFREVAGSFGVILLLVRRHIVIRYSQTFLGLGWLLVQPVANAVAFAFLLGLVGNGMGSSLDRFLVVLCGFVPWTCFVQASERAAMCLTWDERLITKVYFPRLCLPLAAVGSALVDLLIPLLLLLAMGLASGSIQPLRIPLLAFAIALLLSTALGVGLMIAAASLLFRDLRQVHPFLYQIWMVASPVAYSIELIPARWRTIAHLNPVATITGCFRSVFLGHSVPGMTEIALSTIVGLCLFLAGMVSFIRVEPRMADLL